MALKKADEQKDEQVKTPAVADTNAAAAEPGTVDLANSPALKVEPTEPESPAVIEKTAAELAQEKKDQDEFEQKRLDDEAAVREQAGLPAKKELRLVPVENLRPTPFMQYSTGKWIQGHATENLLDDGWLENHVKAKLLKRL